MIGDSDAVAQSGTNGATRMNFTSLDRLLPARPRMLIVTGAGCSTGSGIPDYRDREGEWKRAAPVHLPEFMAKAEARTRYWARSMAGWRAFSLAAPNAAHDELARWEAQAWCHHLITQNVDGLHQRAGQRRVVDLHGRLDTVVCLDCGHRSRRADLQERLLAANPDWTYEIDRIAPDGDVDLRRVDYDAFTVLPCARCGGMLKPDVVFYGENVPRTRVEFCLARLDEADALVVVGSSLMVFSGFRFARHAYTANKPVLVINRGRTRADDLAALKLDADASEALPQLRGWLEARR
ncbi:MAG: NAD-dependent protein deacetylase [Pseudomonadota bacterium]